MGNLSKKFFIPVILILLASLVVLSSLRSFFLEKNDPRFQNTPKLNQKLTDQLFFTPFPKGPEISLGSLLSQKNAQGKKLVLLNFWASWCGPCLIEIPSLLKLKDAYQNDGLDVIFINVDDVPETTLPEVYKKLNAEFKTYVDTHGKLSEYFNVTGLPVSFLINQDLTLVWIELGDKNWDGKDIHYKVSTLLGVQAKR